ncbi:MAG TPA: hypothetical protein VJ967_04030 [Clostridia bacterium]|nr:hypothetical protein [Clostridia bacterium]
MPHNWDIEEVKEVYGHEQVNEYLRNGWVLLATHVVGTMEAGIPNPPLMYVLGRPRKKDQTEE